MTFPDSTLLDEQQASDTFALALKKLGFEQVETLDIYIRNVPLIANRRTDGYASQTEIDGKYVCHHMDNKTKKRLLEKIAGRLSTDLSVEIVPNA